MIDPNYEAPEPDRMNDDGPWWAYCLIPVALMVILVGACIVQWLCIFSST